MTEIYDLDSGPRKEFYINLKLEYKTRRAISANYISYKLGKTI